jgi:hypothetical protein
MRQNRLSINLLAITLLILSALACQTLTKAISPDPSSSVPTNSVNPPSPESGVNGGDVNLTLDWLVTADELNSLSTELGIVEWKLTQDTPGEKRICRSFQGVSWSASPNEGLNCIYTIAAGSTFADVIDSMFKDGNLLEGSQPMNSTLSLDGEFAVYAGTFTNGHTVFDLIWIKDNLLYWSSVTLGTPAGETPLNVYQSAPQAIDTFLLKVVEINLEKKK